MFRVSILFFLLLTSCVPCRNIVHSQQRDSLSIELRSRTITHHDTIYVELPHHAERVTIKEDSSYLSTPYAHSEAIVRPNGELYHTLETHPQSLEKVYDTIIEVRDSIIYRDRTEIKTIEVERQLSWWQEFQIKGFRLLALLIAGGILIRKILG